METIPLEMDDIFGDNDDEENYPGPLPDLPEELEPSQPDNYDAENAEVLSKLKNLSKGASKNTVRRPIPKLDSTRLTGERGIPILPKVFENIKFKGKGHEMQDLKLIMDKLEHWGHRLFPKLPFDEVLARVEKLGSKKEVQTCIKKMRQDMPILASDFVGEEEKEEEPTTNTSEPQKDNVDRDAEDVFDEIMRQEASQTTTQPTVSPVKTKAMLSDDQRERMERNKRLAMEKRLARLGQTPKSKETLTNDSIPQSQDTEILNTDESLTKTTSNNETGNDNVEDEQGKYLTSEEGKTKDRGKVLSDNDKDIVSSLNQEEIMNSEDSVIREKDCKTSSINKVPCEISDVTSTDINTLETTKTHEDMETDDQQTVEELLDNLEDD